jgi:hypothetical protein
VSKSAARSSAAPQSGGQQKTPARVAMNKAEASAARIAARIQASAKTKTGSAALATTSGSRPKTPTDVAMGGTGASVPRTAAQTPTSTARSTSATMAGTITSTTASGTIYDASRDPRRRGR